MKKDLTVRSPYSSRRRSLLLLVVCFTVAGFVLAFLASKGYLSQQQLIVGLLLLVGCVFGLVIFRIYRIRGSSGAETQLAVSAAETSPELSGAVHKLRSAILVLLVMLVFGFWFTRGKPLMPRLVGAAINIGFTSWLLFLLYRVRRRVK
jgi:hypothetical protein